MTFARSAKRSDWVVGYLRDPRDPTGKKVNRFEGPEETLRGWMAPTPELAQVRRPDASVVCPVVPPGGQPEFKAQPARLFRYKYLDEAYYMQDRAFAQRVIAAETADLGIAPPATLSLFAPAAEHENADFDSATPMAGFYFWGGGAREIGLCVDDDPEAFLKAILHEVAHMAGMREEDEARAFATEHAPRFAAKYLEPAPPPGPGWTWEQWQAIVMYAKHQGASAREIAEALAQP